MTSQTILQHRWMLFSQSRREVAAIYESAPVSIGRGDICDINVLVPSVSRIHMWLSTVASGDLLLQDTSSFGTFVSYVDTHGAEVSKTIKKERLQVPHNAKGISIILGLSAFTFQFQQRARRSGTSTPAWKEALSSSAPRSRAVSPSRYLGLSRTEAKECVTATPVVVEECGEDVSETVVNDECGGTCAEVVYHGPTMTVEEVITAESPKRIPTAVLITSDAVVVPLVLGAPDGLRVASSCITTSGDIPTTNFNTERITAAAFTALRSRIASEQKALRDAIESLRSKCDELEEVEAADRRAYYDLRVQLRNMREDRDALLAELFPVKVGGVRPRNPPEM